VAERLAGDSLLKANMEPVSLVPPSFVPESREERDTRAKIVMSVIEIANPFGARIDVLHRYLTTGTLPDDDLSFLPPDLRDFHAETSGLNAASTRLEIKGSETGLVDLIIEKVRELIGMMELGLRFPENETFGLLYGEAQSLLMGLNIEEELASRGAGQARTLLNGAGLFPFDGEVGVGATLEEVFTGNYYDGMGQRQNHIFAGGEIYGPKGAYVRYLYDMVRPLPPGDMTREDLHLAALRMGDDDVLEYCERGNVGASGFELPMSYGAFERFAVANGIDTPQEQLQHFAMEGHQPPGDLPEWLDTARIRHSMQASAAIKVAPQPPFEEDKEAFLQSLSGVYTSFVEMEKREVVFATPPALRGNLEADFELRKRMRFPRGCVPFLGVLDTFV